jgi:hypothetical protein
MYTTYRGETESVVRNRPIFLQAVILGELAVGRGCRSQQQFKGWALGVPYYITRKSKLIRSIP